MQNVINNGFQLATCGNCGFIVTVFSCSILLFCFSVLCSLNCFSNTTSTVELCQLCNIL